jgi:glycolate oxidase iron-sulfur subunit
MRSVVDGRLELTDSVQQHLDLCLDCRSCETACPSGVQYGRLIEPFRVGIARAKASGGTNSARDWFSRFFLYGLFPYPRRMRWALAPARVLQALRLDRALDRLGLPKLLPEKLRRMHDQLPRLQRRAARFPAVLPAVGPKRARVGLFTGCVADAMFGQTNWATARVLQANGCEVVVPGKQVCCGAIHYHSGSAAPALDFARTNSAAFAADGLDAVIINVAGCGSMLKDYGHIVRELAPQNDSLHESLARFAAKVRDVSEFLVELGPVPPAGEIPLRAVYHDACHLVHAQRVREQPRELLSLVPGLELAPLAEAEICCGAAGSYNLTEPEMSDRLAQRKVANILATKPQAVITGNAGCSLQIQAALRRAGANVWVAHPMDLLDLSYRGLKPPKSARV